MLGLFGSGCWAKLSCFILLVVFFSVLLGQHVGGDPEGKFHTG